MKTLSILHGNPKVQHKADTLKLGHSSRRQFNLVEIDVNQSCLSTKRTPARTLQTRSFTLNTEAFNSRPFTLTNVWTVGTWIGKKKRKEKKPTRAQTVAPHWDAASNAERIGAGSLCPSAATHRSGCLFLAPTTNLLTPLHPHPPHPLPFFVALLFVMFPFNTKHILMQTPTDTGGFCLLFLFRGAKKICSSQLV